MDEWMDATLLCEGRQEREVNETNKQTTDRQPTRTIHFVSDYQLLFMFKHDYFLLYISTQLGLAFNLTCLNLNICVTLN